MLMRSPVIIILAATALLSFATNVLVLSSSPKGYEIVRDKVVYSRWRSIISRVVRMPNGNEVDYDVSIPIKVL
jgi:hypothetical protein